MCLVRSRWKTGRGLRSGAGRPRLDAVARLQQSTKIEFVINLMTKALGLTIRLDAHTQHRFDRCAASVRTRPSFGGSYVFSRRVRTCFAKSVGQAAPFCFGGHRYRCFTPGSGGENPRPVIRGAN
jgi:hypothetical protein